MRNTYSEPLLPSQPPVDQSVIDFDEVKPLPGSEFLPRPTGFTVPSQVKILGIKPLLKSVFVGRTRSENDI